MNSFRIWAVVTSNDGFSYGLGESLLTAQLPLVIRARYWFLIEIAIFR